MPTTLSTVTNISKEIYQGTIQDQLQDEIVALKRIERTSEGVESQVGGKYVTFPVRVKRNNGIGSRAESAALPAAGQQGWESVRVGLKYDYGRVQLTGQTIELVNENYQAFASAMDLEMTGLKNDLAKDQNRQVYGTTKGTLATTTAVASANVVTVDTTQYLEVGQQIDIVEPSVGTVRGSNRQITAINEATKVVTYDGADVTTDVIGDLLVRTGNFNNEIHGLADIVAATGELFNINPSTVPQWASTVYSNSGTGRPLSEGLMITATDDVRRKGGKTSLILTSLGVRRAYFNLLSQQRRYPSTTEFEGGFKGLAFSNGREIPVIEDVDCPASTMWFLDESKLKVYRSQDWHWEDKDGAIWKWVTGFDAYEALMKLYWELGTNQRNAHAVLKDVTEG